jgi:hypothetical protein
LEIAQYKSNNTRRRIKDLPKSGSLLRAAYNKQNIKPIRRKKRRSKRTKQIKYDKSERTLKKLIQKIKCQIINKNLL